MKIRRAVAADIPAIDKLLYQVHQVHADKRPDLFIPGMKKYTDEELEVLLKDQSRPVFVAEEEEILGYAFCVIQEDRAASHPTVRTLYIDDLCVDEESRGKKVGSALFAFVKDYAKKECCHNLTLNVWACNPSAFAFYQKCGLEIQKYGMEVIL